VVGDQHPWKVSIFDGGGADFWQYRDFVDRFPNEGGVLGASLPATLRQFLPESERVLFSPSWQHHDNPLAALGGAPGELGRAYQTVRLWTGRDPLAMTMDEYAYVSALLQAEGLSEYIANYRRRMFSSASAIFWMYNDSWPVTHGWTIVDYYLRRKLAYHPVRRAFQPVTVVVVAEGSSVIVYGVNDTPHAWTGQVRYGLFALAGGLPLDRLERVTLPANASTPIAGFAKGEWEAVGLRDAGAFAALLDGGRVAARHRLFLERFGDLHWAPADVRAAVQGDNLELVSDTYAWGVCLDAEAGRPLADNCFDLLPGIAHVVPGAAGEQVVRIGNRDVFGVA
jgi:beta-mannosidase